MRNQASALIIFALMLNMPVAAAQDLSQAEKVEKGKEYLRKWIEAIGGFDCLSRIGDLKTASAMEVVPKGFGITVRTYKKGFHYRADYEMMGMMFTVVLNGEEVWVNDSEGVTTDVIDEIKDLVKIMAFEHEALLNPEKIGHIFTYEGRKTVDGNECILLNQKTKEGAVVTHYVDAKTFLRYKIRFMSSDVEVEIIESEYRDVDGIKVAFLNREFHDGIETAITRITEFKYNVNLPDSLFIKP
jgi:outer membrane lipoprotein-sorting protein